MADLSFELGKSQNKVEKVYAVYVYVESFVCVTALLTSQLSCIRELSKMPRTRSQKKEADLVYYQTLSDPHDGSNKIRVISKRKLKDNPDHHKILKDKFDQIEKKDVVVPVDKTLVFITHVNVFLYAACFFIQVGTLPVSRV